MIELPIESADRELIDVATALLQRRYEKGLHHVAAALRCGDDRIYTGLHVASRRINVCAEHTCLGQAHIDGQRTLVTCAAVIKMEPDDPITVTSPCGVCRELLTFYQPDMGVIVSDRSRTIKVRAAELLPAPWLLPAESDAHGSAERGEWYS